MDKAQRARVKTGHPMCLFFVFQELHLCTQSRNVKDLNPPTYSPSQTSSISIDLHFIYH